MNRSIVFAALFALILVTAAGCSTNYWNNRGNDAADIMTFTIGWGFGGAARVGPLHAGLCAYGEWVGLRGGHCGDMGEIYVKENAEKARNIYGKVPAAFSYYPAFSGEYTFGTYDNFEMGRIPAKNYRTGDNPEFVNYGYPLITGANCPWDPEAPTVLPYYTQIEATGAGLFGVRVGFNIGEFADFLLGFTTLDIYGDDEFYAETPCEACLPVTPNPNTTAELVPEEDKTIAPPVLPETPAVPANKAKETYQDVTP